MSAVSPRFGALVAPFHERSRMVLIDTYTNEFSYFATALSVLCRCEAQASDVVYSPPLGELPHFIPAEVSHSMRLNRTGRAGGRMTPVLFGQQKDVCARRSLCVYPFGWECTPLVHDGDGKECSRERSIHAVTTVLH